MTHHNANATTAAAIAPAAAAVPVIELAGFFQYPPELDWFLQGHFVDAGENAIVFGGPGSGKFNLCKQTVAANIAARGKTSFLAVVADWPWQEMWNYPAIKAGPDGTLVETPACAIPGIDPRMIDCDLLVLDGLPKQSREFHKKCEELLALRTKLGRSTIVLVDDWRVNPNILAEHYPDTDLSARPWHVLKTPPPPQSVH